MIDVILFLFAFWYHRTNAFCVIVSSCSLPIMLVIIIVILEGEECGVWAEHVLYGRSPESRMVVVTWLWLHMSRLAR